MNTFNYDDASQVESNERDLRALATHEDAERFARDLDVISDSLPMPTSVSNQTNYVRKFTLIGM